MAEEHEQDAAEEQVETGEAPVSADALKDDPGPPAKGVQWDAPQRAEDAAESAEAAAAEDSAAGD